MCTWPEQKTGMLFSGKTARALPSKMAQMQQVLQYPNLTFLFAVSQMPAQLIGKTDNSIY